MPTTLQSILEEFRQAAVSMRDMGDKFERLFAAYLITDPLYRDRFSDVWLWTEWPGRGNKPDTGIDIVAKERYTGEYCAIQCKFFEPSHTLQKADIDSFFTASGKAPFTSRIIVSTTDRWSSNAEAALENQQIPAKPRDQPLGRSTTTKSGTFRVAFGKTEIVLHDRVGALMDRYLSSRKALAPLYAFRLNTLYILAVNH